MFDGDTCSANGVYMDNSIKEITDKLKQKEFYAFLHIYNNVIYWNTFKNVNCDESGYNKL